MPLTNRLHAEQIALAYIETIIDLCVEAHIVGSIRRLKSLVKDIDLVILPEDIHALWQRLDQQVTQGIIEKGHSWGISHRSLTFKNINIEIFTADENNRGYKLWLRTGPAEPSHYVMIQLSKHKSTVRFQGGYAWHVDYDETNPAFDRNLGYAKIAKLKVSNEWQLFRLIGLSYIAPPARNEITYGRLNRSVDNPPAEALKPYYIEKPVNQPRQLKMF